MILGLATNFLKSLGAKKAKSSGKKMAKNITNESEEKESVVKPSPPEKKSDVKGADLTPLEDIRDDMKASSKKSKDPLNLALDGIDSALFGIIDTLTKTNLVRKKIESNENKAELDKKKSLRERMLEASSGFVKGAVGTVKALTGSAWDKLMNFLTWTLLGAVVNYIIKNWESVKEKILGMVDQLKEVFTRLKPILVIIKDIVLWLGTTAWDWIVRIKDVIEGTTPQKIKEIEEILKDPKMLEKAWKGNSKQLEKLFNELEKAETREEKSKVMRKYAPLFDTQRGKSLKLWKRMKGPGFQGTLNILDPHFWQAITGTGEVQYFKPDEKDPRYKGELIGGEEELLMWFHTEEGKRYLRDHHPDVLKKVESGWFKEQEEYQHLFKTENKNVNLNFSSAMDIESYYVGLEEYSDVFDTESSIILFSQENETGMNYMGSDINFDYKMPETTLNIKELFLLEKLNK